MSSTPSHLSSLPENRSETAFEEIKAPLIRHQAETEAHRCLYCSDAPCIQACPTAINIPEFIRKIATGNIRGSARTIFDANILGMSCSRVCPVEVLCAGACVFNEMDTPPIQIGRLQRYSTDMAFTEGWHAFEAGPPTGKSVGLVGGGPAALAAAHRLRQLGHSCTIYEKREALGGLNSRGIAPYKMQASRALEEVNWVLQIGGIEVKTGIDVPADVSWDTLEQRHDALFLGFGLGPDRDIAGSRGNLSGIHGAVEYIEQIKHGSVDLTGICTAAVIGGGNTAIDSARQLRGLGVPEVTLIYRGNPSQMKGYQHEWSAARTEEVGAAWYRQPTEFVGESGKVCGVKCVWLDEARQPMPGSEHTIPADLVLVAIGQAKLGSLVAGLPGVEIDAGRIVVDETGATGRPGVYSGGDCANGGREVVNAVAEGAAAARTMDAFLMRGGPDA